MSEKNADLMERYMKDMKDALDQFITDSDRPANKLRLVLAVSRVVQEYFE